MVRTESDHFSWSADAGGTNLIIRTPEARQIAAALKEGKVYAVEIKGAKRTLDQNALYWVVLAKFAKAMGMSNNEAHNRMLRAYGQPEIVEGRLVPLVLPDTDEAERQALEAETFHIKPTTQVKVGKDGLDYRTYLLLRGSSSYDTAEMTRLIDGLLAECEQIELDVLTPSQRALLEEANARLRNDHR